MTNRYYDEDDRIGFDTDAAAITFDQCDCGCEGVRLALLDEENRPFAFGTFQPGTVKGRMMITVPEGLEQGTVSIDPVEWWQ
jgi:hypothetical protein